MAEDPCLSPAPARGPQPEADQDEPPLDDGWREAMLAQLDAWVEERERLIDALDMRIGLFRKGGVFRSAPPPDLVRSRARPANGAATP